MSEKARPVSDKELVQLAHESFGWLLTLSEIEQMIKDVRDFPDFLPMKADKRFPAPERN